MIVAIHQPNFLPWLGYFQKLLYSDLFILLDNVQLPRGKSYCTRTALSNGQSASWLTVPVLNKGELPLINQVKIANNQPWIRKHLGTIHSFYSQTPYFERYYDDLVKIYNQNHQLLVNLNYELIVYLAKQLEAKTELVFASQILPKNLGGADYLISLIKAVGGETYLSGTGKGSSRYIREEQFAQAGITLSWQNFSYPNYLQRGKQFVPNLSLLDLLFYQGDSAREILLSGGDKQ
jgi:hypothetical protein